MSNEWKFTIHAETPAKKNSRINLRNGISIPSKKYQEWHKAAVSELMPQIRTAISIKEPCEISLKFVHGDFRRRDSDNGCSSIMDLLTDCGIIEDDNWRIVRKINIENEYEEKKPKCEITIKLI